jgi:hypothetical protein
MSSFRAAFAVQVLGTVAGLVGMFLVLATGPNGGMDADVSTARAVWSSVVFGTGIIGIPLAYLVYLIHQNRRSHS